MKVFEVVPNFAFHGFATWDEDENEGQYRLNGTPKLADWRPLPIYWEKPKQKHANIEVSFRGGYALDDRALKILAPILGNTCELLPLLPSDGVTYHLLNVLVTADCLDREKTKYMFDMVNSSMIDQYAFIAALVPVEPLFRLLRRSAILTHTGMGDSGKTFKTVVETEGLTGIQFKELWSDSE